MSVPSGETIEVFRGADLSSHDWSSVRQLATEAEAEGKAVSILAAPVESRKIMAKRRHDLKAALRTLGFTVEALKAGYTFQDEAAAAKVEAIAKAVQVLEREATLLTRALPE
jgi:hypothetical protein